MKFRPCIDIYKGNIVQIVGSTLREGQQPTTHFESELFPAHLAELYKTDGLAGGHVIMLSREAVDEEAALACLRAYPGGLHVGGGITPDNAQRFLDAGASHVIVTSYVFRDGRIDDSALDRLEKAVGKHRLVLDLSCRRRGDDYLIVTDRWQKWTEMPVNAETLDRLADHCAEYLVHGVDAEGKKQGVELLLVDLLGKWNGIPVTYAGGIKDFRDVKEIYQRGNGRLDFTIGSALDIFGGSLPYKEVVAWHNRCNQTSGNLR